MQAGKSILATELHEYSSINTYPCFGGNGIRGYLTKYSHEGVYPIIGRQGALCGNINIAKGKFYATEHAVVVDYFANTNALLWTLFLENLNLNQYATATAQPGLSVAKIEEIPIPVPPLQEQTRIVEAVNNWMECIDQLIESTNSMAQSIVFAKSKILDLAMQGKLVPQDPADEPAADMLRRIYPKAKIITDNPQYQQLPSGWCVTTIKDVFEINPKNKAGEELDAGFVPMASIADGFNNSFDYTTRKWKEIKNGFTHFADGDIAVAKISPCLENRKSMILNNLPNGIGSGTTELLVFRSQAIYSEYGLIFFKSDSFINHCVGTFNGVVGQQRVGKNIVEDIHIPIPPLEEQKRIVKIVRDLFGFLNEVESNLLITNL